MRVPAKVNLALCVGPVRGDGYHPLATVFQAVSLFDEVSARRARAGHFSVTVAGEGAEQVPIDDSNLALRAARRLASAHGREDVGVELEIKKSIPVAGGMAGGSADAAAALLACSILWDLDIQPDELAAVGAELGSDVPFALMGNCAVGTGRGEQLVPALTRGTYHWVFALADEGLSTPAVFKRLDEMRGYRQGQLSVPTELMNALASGDPVALGRALVNDLQIAALDLRPELRRTLDAGLDNGALGAIVSGSGPTCAFLTADESRAVDLSVRLSAEGVARHVRRAAGPVPGARLIS